MRATLRAMDPTTSSEWLGHAFRSVGAISLQFAHVLLRNPSLPTDILKEALTKGHHAAWINPAVTLLLLSDPGPWAHGGAACALGLKKVEYRHMYDGQVVITGSVASGLLFGRLVSESDLARKVLEHVQARKPFPSQLGEHVPQPNTPLYAKVCEAIRSNLFPDLPQGPMANYIPVCQAFIDAFNPAAVRTRAPTDLHELMWSRLYLQEVQARVTFAITFQNQNGGDQHEYIEPECLYDAECDDPILIAFESFDLGVVEAYNLFVHALHDRNMKPEDVVTLQPEAYYKALDVKQEEPAAGDKDREETTPCP